MNNYNDLIARLEEKALERREKLTEDYIQAQTDVMYEKALEFLDEYEDNYEAWLIFANLGTEITKRAEENGVFKGFSAGGFDKVADMARESLYKPLVRMYKKQFKSLSLKEIKDKVKDLRKNIKGINKLGILPDEELKPCKLIIETGFDDTSRVILTTDMKVNNNNVTTKKLKAQYLIENLYTDFTTLAELNEYVLESVIAVAKMRGYKVVETLLVEGDN